MDSSLGLDGHLCFGHVADVELVFSIERHDRGQCRAAFFVEDDLGLTVVNDGDASIRCSEVYSYDGHSLLLGDCRVCGHFEITF